MAWDTEETQRRLLAAGSRQFAAHGFAGARMDAIGADAGVNKERVYRYFGDKSGFFTAVLAHELTAMLDGITVTASGGAALGEFTGQLFDRFAERQQVPRLLGWEGLERDADTVWENRRAMCASVADRLALALPARDRAEVEHLLLTAIAVVTSVWVLPQLAHMVTGSSAENAERRGAVVAQMTLLGAGAA